MCGPFVLEGRSLAPTSKSPADGRHWNRRRRDRWLANSCVVHSPAMDEDRQERLAKNESLFRELNENIGGLASTLGGGAPFEFICECSTSGCFERLSLTLDEYERVREDSTHFLLADGHQDIEIEQVISRHKNYVVVEKDGVAGLVAADDDPRA
jgi:hypothetical protein